MQSNNAFIFKGHKWDQEVGRATFSYQLKQGNEVFDFMENLWFPLKAQADKVPAKLFKNILDNLLLVLGISYYKLFCPQQIIIEGINLSKEQADFWDTLYTKGLGEFFYKNKIDFRGLVNFPYSEKGGSYATSFPLQNRLLLGIGGGKDSIVAAEFLKKIGKSFSAFCVNIHPIMEQTIQLLGVDKVIVKREIDPLLFKLNKRSDAYNGHVPVSAQNAFIGLSAALLFDYKYIVMANEQSANYGNVEYLGAEINHQWSKSYEFEKLFQDYVNCYITYDVKYFSILRSFTEIKIAKIFAEHPKYFQEFSSCNKNFRIKNKTSKKWCGECAKCAFTYAMLSAHLPKKDLISIFGQNLFAKTDLLSIYKELLGVSDIKPFDCVGTPGEVKVAFYLAMLKKEYENDLIMQYFKKDVLPNIPDIEELKGGVFKNSEEHSIPEEFQDVLKI